MKLFKNLFLFILIFGQLGTTYILKEGGVELARWTEEDGSDAVQVINTDEGFEDSENEVGGFAEEEVTEEIETFAAQEEIFEFEDTRESSEEELAPKKTVDDFFNEIVSPQVETEEPSIREVDPDKFESEEDEFSFLDREPESEKFVDDMGKEAVQEMKVFEEMLLQDKEANVPVIQEEEAIFLSEPVREVQKEMKEEANSWEKDLWEDAPVTQKPLSKTEMITKEEISKPNSNPVVSNNGVVWEEAKLSPQYVPPVASAKKPITTPFSDFTSKIQSETKPMSSVTSQNFQRQVEKLTGWAEGRSGYEQALSYQNQTGQPILVYFYASRCVQCKRFDRDVLNKSETINFLNALTKVKMDVSANQDIYSRYRSRIYPAFYVHHRSGRKTPIYERTHPEFFIEEVKKALV